MLSVDLNCDLGESFGAYTIGMDEQVIPLITSANVACGYHAGDPMVMRRTVELCREHGVSVGAHPGFPDLVGFGRRNLAVTPAEAKACVQYQIGALQAFCRAVGLPLRHVKPHGALYNMAAKDAALARALVEGIAEIDDGLVLLALSNSEMSLLVQLQGEPLTAANSERALGDYIHKLYECKEQKLTVSSPEDLLALSEKYREKKGFDRA